MKSSLLLALVAITSFGACGGTNQRAATTPPAPTPSPTSAPLAHDSKSPQAGVVHISEDIRKACGISDADAHFAFDSASLGQSERPVLTQLATCFISGPLKGREMRLVGHADPRGGDDYNMVLGGSRADTVKTFLTMRGVPNDRIATTSRGEMDAQGTDETSWAEDRRVDVLLR
ncbi:MAG TPA: OmpA family protein [Polyangiaceae bacterium]|nr:OmpA family protein [Polyangiaceae bacterium]